MPLPDKLEHYRRIGEAYRLQRAAARAANGPAHLTRKGWWVLGALAFVVALIGYHVWFM